MAEKLVYEIDINGSKSAKTLGQLNSELEQMREELDSIPIGSQEFKKMAREISKTESEVKNLEASFEGMDMEQKLTAATDVVAGLAGGFAAVEGAIAIAGVESEAFEETMTKVTGAMAFATGIKDMGAAAVAMKKLTDVSEIQAKAQKVLNFVMNLNPIGLIVTAIGLLIAGIIALQKPIQNAIAKFESMNGIAKVLIGVLAGPLLAAIYGVTKALEFFGVINSKTQNDAISAAEKRRKAEIKAHLERIKELDKEIDKLDEQIDQIRKGREAVELRYDREIELARAAGKDTTRLEGEKLDDTIERVRKEIIALEERYRLEREQIQETLQLSKKIGFDTGELKFIRSVTDAKLTERRKEVEETKKILDELEHDRKVHNEEVAKEQRDADEERQKEARDRYRDHLEKMRDIEMFYEDLRAENISDEYERELEKERLRYERIREEYKGHAEVLEQLEIEHQANLLKIEKTETQRRIEQIEQLEKEAAQRREERLKEEERLAAENRKMVVTDYNNYWQSEEDRRAERDRKTRLLRVQQFNEEFEKRIAIVDQYFSSFSQLNNAFNQLQDNLRNKDEKASLQQQKNRFNREKAFNIASTAIETSKAIMGAVAASPATFGLPFSAFAAATGAVQIAAIAAKKFNPSGGGGSVSVPAPSFSGTTSQPSTPDADGIDPETLLPGSGGGGQMSQRVYVTEGDITRTQNRVNQIAQIRET